MTRMTRLVGCTRLTRLTRLTRMTRLTRLTSRRDTRDAHANQPNDQLGKANKRWLANAAHLSVHLVQDVQPWQRRHLTSQASPASQASQASPASQASQPSQASQASRASRASPASQSGRLEAKPHKTLWVCYLVRRKNSAITARLPDNRRLCELKKKKNSVLYWLAQVATTPLLVQIELSGSKHSKCLLAGTVLAVHNQRGMISVTGCSTYIWAVPSRNAVPGKAVLFDVFVEHGMVVAKDIVLLN